MVEIVGRGMIEESSCVMVGIVYMIGVVCVCGEGMFVLSNEWIGTLQGWDEGGMM